MLSILPDYDLFVHPSRTTNSQDREGIPNSLLEAMANSRAIVGSDSGAIPEIVRHGENGLLFAPGDSDSLAEAILRLIRSPDERIGMGEQGKRAFHERFRLEREVADTERLYRSLLDSRK